MSTVVSFSRSHRLNKFVSNDNPGGIIYDQYRGQNTGRIHGLKWNYQIFKKFAKDNQSKMSDFIKNHKYIQALNSEKDLIDVLKIDSPVLFALYVDQLKKIKTKHLQAKKVPGFESFLDYIFLRTIELYSVNPQCKDWEYHSKVFAAMLPKMEQNGKVIMFSSSVRKMIDEIENIKLYGL